MEIGRRPALRVEGKDDAYTLRHLLIRHGIAYDDPPWPAWYPIIESGRDGGKAALLQSVPTLAAVSEGRPVGIVADANASLRESWREARRALRKAGVDDPPTSISAEGFIGQSVRYDTPVGVWLMPDNEREGTIETFIETLIAPDDALLAHARASTHEARLRGAPFKETHFAKAALHTWLAWQQEPGLPYGSAVRARFLEADSETAQRFVAWFRRLYEPDAP